VTTVLIDRNNRFLLTNSMGWFKDLYHSHQSLKERIHKTRIPLSLRGQKFMGLVYFTIPLIIGKFAYDWTMRQNHANWKVDEKTGSVVLPKGLIERKDEVNRNAANARVLFDKIIKESKEDNNVKVQ